MGQSEQLRLIEDRMKSFQESCNQRLTNLSQFFNDRFDELVKQLIGEFKDLIVRKDENQIMMKQEIQKVDYSDCDLSTLLLNKSDSEAPIFLEPTSGPTSPGFSEESLSQNAVSASPPAKHQSPRVAKTFQCDICPMRSATKQSFQYHRRTHTGENAMQCDICKKFFILKQSLIIHMRTHTDERPYMCHLCPKTFKQSAPFRRHMRTHSQEKPYPCPRCDRAFIEKSYLKVHMQTHTGERPHECPVCHRGYSKRYHVRQHLKKFHQVDDVNGMFPHSRRRTNTGMLKLDTDFPAIG